MKTPTRGAMVAARKPRLFTERRGAPILGNSYARFCTEKPSEWRPDAGLRVLCDALSTTTSCDVILLKKLLDKFGGE